MSLKEQNLEQKNPTNYMCAFYIYIFKKCVCICVCVSVCIDTQRERERERAAKILHNGLATWVWHLKKKYLFIFPLKIFYKLYIF